MSFPLDNAKLVSHLRSSYLVSFDDDTDIRRLIRPNDNDLDGQYNDVFEKLVISSSPPITFIDKIVENKMKRRSKIRKRKPVVRPVISEEDFDKPSVTQAEIDEELDPEMDLDSDSDITQHQDVEDKSKNSQTINAKRVKDNIIRLFHKDSDSGSDGSVRTTKFESLDQSEYDSDSTQKLPDKAISDTMTLSSGDTHSFNPDMTLESKDSFDSLEYEEDGEDDEDDDDESTDSAFTDIETDSIMDSSMLLDSFEFKTQKKKGSFGLNGAKHPGNTAPKANKLSVSYSGSNLTTTSRVAKTILTFDKVDFSSEPHSSNLSSLIQTRSKSANTNPLNYYSFVNSESGAKVKINVFVPPLTTPTLTELDINNNVAVSDCIGYILLQLSNNDKDSDLLDPNNWRLELVDEDGENYGSFGILDRSRLFSSYNNPRDIAICKVTDIKEIKKNEKASPLASEFKQNLAAYRRRQIRLEDDSIASIKDHHSVEYTQLSIILPNRQKLLVDFDNRLTVKEVLFDFCTQYNLNPANYRARLVIPESHHLDSEILTLKQDSLGSEDDNRRYLGDHEMIKDLEYTNWELVPSKTGPVQSLLDGSYRASTEIDNSISPVNPDLTAPSKPEIYTKRSNQGRRKSSKDIMDSDHYFDMLGANPDVLNGNNARYFTWKVWRKKTTIINKIEKSLIIDGDYIRLQPPEDKAYLKNPDDNPFLQSQSNSHHHRHLHHYNYANYYNSSMMKTSSFHITQVVKLKQYKNSKNPNHFKIVIEKPGKDNTTVQKKYDLEAVDQRECQDIVDKIRWVLKMYNSER